MFGILFLFWTAEKEEGDVLAEKSREQKATSAPKIKRLQMDKKAFEAGRYTHRAVAVSREFRNSELCYHLAKGLFVLRKSILKSESWDPHHYFSKTDVWLPKKSENSVGLAKVHEV